MYSFKLTSISHGSHSPHIQETQPHITLCSREDVADGAGDRHRAPEGRDGAQHQGDVEPAVAGRCYRFLEV